MLSEEKKKKTHKNALDLTIENKVTVWGTEKRKAWSCEIYVWNIPNKSVCIIPHGHLIAR